nr:NUDIX hydrolase [Kineosphaera limosa]
MPGHELVDRHDPRPVRRREVPFTGMVWAVQRDTFDLGEGGVVTREYLEHPGAVITAPYREVQGRPQLLFIQQYRHPVGTYEWELPAGLLDVAGEDPHAAAIRELAEEVDLTAAQWHVVADFYASPGGMNEALRIYLARDLAAVPPEQRHQREAEELGMPTAWVDLEDAVAAALSGRINNAGVVVGVLAVEAARARGFATLRAADVPWPQHPSNQAR